ncbi:MAG: hypothetical protein KatS3mg077_0808 [Candidatus Binatia bacterium]|nr:MAG: hypothetical protein KatS3mg077_0808 [Candidatus Binatia bacterium]
MKRSKWAVRGMCGALFVLGFVFGVVPAHAAPDKCQAELAKRSALLHAKVASALQKCGDAIRREQAKNLAKAGSGFLVTAAHVCQKELNRIFDLPNILSGKSERQKFFDAVDKAFTAGTTPKCSVSDLEWQGLVHSSNTNGLGIAPAVGSNAWDFAKVWLAVMQMQRALDGQLAVQADFLARLQEAIAAPAKPPGTSVSTAATNCTLPVSCDPRTQPGCRPDLCRFRPLCLRQGCGLAASSSAQLAETGANETYPVQGLMPLAVCSLTGLGFPFGNLGEGVLLAGGPSRSIAPLSIPASSALGIAGSTMCVDVVRTMGYCACSPPLTGAPIDFTLCRDHVEGNGVACTGLTVAGSGGADAVHGGTANSAIHVSAGGAAVTNDCVAWATLRLSAVPSGNEGPDGAPCTADDFNPTVIMAAAALTTGSANATVEDAVAAAGTCSASSTSCVEDANCPSGQTCTSPAPTLTSSTLPAPLSGAPVSSGCANILANQLSGLALVGATPLLDVPVASGPGARDTLLGLSLVCP